MFLGLFRFNGLPRLALAPVLVLLVAAAQAADVRISGIGLSTPLMQRMAHAYGKKQPGDSVTIVSPPLGSTGGIRALGNGNLDLAITGRPPTPEELSKVGKVVDLARTALGFATSGGNLPAGLTTASLADIYAERLVHWGEGQPIRLIMRPERESDTILMRRFSSETDAALNIAFARKGLVVADNDLDTIKLLETIPGSFGPATTALARLQNSRIKFFPLNGVLPSAKTVANGAYPLVKSLYAVLPVQPAKSAERFLAFIRSPEGRSIIAAADFVSVGQ